MTPTARTLVYLRDLGFRAEVVEKWVKPPGMKGFKKDLFGIVDIVAFRPGFPKTLFLQVTSSSNIAARKRKAEEVKADDLISASREFWVWGWKKVKNRWQVEGDRLTLAYWDGRYHGKGGEVLSLREALVG